MALLEELFVNYLTCPAFVAGVIIAAWLHNWFRKSDKHRDRED